MYNQDISNSVQSANVPQSDIPEEDEELRRVMELSKQDMR